MSSILKINGTSLNAVSEALKEYMPKVVGMLADRYKFSAVEALALLGEIGVEKEGKSQGVKEKRVVPSILLPFCGVVEEEWCKAVRYNHGLYTQCTNACKGEKFCKTCAKSLSDEGIPTYGVIEDRSKEGWSDHKGKCPVKYLKIMSKINVTKEQAIAEADKLGWTIAEEQFEVVKIRKGRPAKKATETDEAPKKRGRPKKSKPFVEAADTGDDLIAQLVQQAQNEVVPATEPAAEPAAEPKNAAKKTKVPKKTLEENEAEKLAKAGAKKQAAAEKKAAKEAAKEDKKQAAAEKKAAKEDKKQAAAEKKAAKEDKKQAAAEKENDAKKQAEDDLLSLMRQAAKGAEETAKKAAKKEELVEMANEDHVNDAKKVEEELVEDPLDEEEEDDAVPVIKFTYDGVEYYHDGDGIVYDIESEEEVGVWDDETKTLTLN